MNTVEIFEALASINNAANRILREATSGVYEELRAALERQDAITHVALQSAAQASNPSIVVEPAPTPPQPQRKPRADKGKKRGPRISVGPRIVMVGGKAYRIGSAQHKAAVKREVAAVKRADAKRGRPAKGKKS